MINSIKCLFQVYKNTNSTFLLSNADVISSMNFSRADVVDMFGLNPYWPLLKIECLSMNLSSLTLSSFSRILENCGKREIGL